MVHLTREVRKLPGIHDVAFESKSKMATVIFDPRQVSAEEVKAAVQRANEQMEQPDAGTGPAAGVIL